MGEGGAEAIGVDTGDEDWVEDCQRPKLRVIGNGVTSFALNRGSESRDNLAGFYLRVEALNTSHIDV